MSVQGRKYFMSPAMRPKGSVIVGQNYRMTHSYDESTENELRVEACPRNENNDGWLQMTATKYGEKRSTNVYLCLNREQAISLRDLLNTAFGGSSREHTVIEGSMFMAPERNVTNA